MKCFESDRLSTSSRLSRKRFCSVQKCKFIKLHFDYDVVMTSPISYDTYPEVMINRAQFDVCTFSSFGEVKAYVRAHMQTA